MKGCSHIELASASREALPPHSPQDEAGLLGSLLQAPERIPVVARTFGADNPFYLQPHRLVWSAIGELDREQVAVDAVSVAAKLRDRMLDAAAFVSGLVDASLGASFFDSYLLPCRDAFLRRRILAAAADAAAQAQDQSARPELILTGWRDAADYLETVAGNAGKAGWLSLVDDAAEIVGETLPPPVQIVEGLVPERGKFMLGSGSKSFKTWLTLDAGLSIAHGAQFLGRETERHHVLYVNLELKPDTFKRRVQVLAECKGLSVDAGWFFHLPLRGRLSGLRVSQVVDRVAEVIEHTHAEVVVLDPLYKLNLDGEENNARDQTLLFNELDRLIGEAGVTLILNDHFSKGNQSEKDPLDAIRGSSAKGGDVDAAMVLRRHEVVDCFRVDVVHRELPPVEPFTIGWHFPLMEVRADLDPERMKKAAGGRRPQHDPLDLCRVILDTSPDNPITISAWADLARIPRKTLATYTEDLRRQGLIGTIGDGCRARQFVTEKGRVECTNK